MLRYTPPIAIGVALLGAALFNGYATDRWSGGNSKAELCSDYLKLVPMTVGPWEGEDQVEVDDRIRRVAGMVGDPVSRRYTNQATDEVVDVWLIVGPGSNMIRHTPNVCMPSANFKPEEKADTHYVMPVEGQEPLTTWTNLFSRPTDTGRVARARVFWMWCRPTPGGLVVWDAPGEHVSDARYRFGSAKALFKMYFTAYPSRPGAVADESVANEFAQHFVPELNALIARAARGEKPALATQTEATAVETGSVEADADAAAETARLAGGNDAAAGA
ncbi:MAG: exosortase-associated EpsI family protein [Planctomycetota bacterium]